MDDLLDTRYITDSTGKSFADELTNFVIWYLNNRMAIPQVPIYNGHSFVEGVSGVVLYRCKPFQVELFIIKPDFHIPIHTHPNVDSYEVFLSGMEFVHNDEVITKPEQIITENSNGISILSGALIRVRPTDRHGGRSSSFGGSFLSIQHWLNNTTPTSVENDWSGDYMNTEHKYIVEDIVKGNNLG